MRKTWLVAAGLLAGCSSTTENPRSCLDGYCSEAAYPFCDTDGSIGGTKFECVAVACTAGEPAGCTGDTELTCNPTGTSYDSRSCEFGCDPVAERCRPCDPADPACEDHIVPRYVPDACEDFAAGDDLVVSVDTLIDTSNAAACNGGVFTQPSAPELCLVRYRTIRIERNRTLRARGTRVLAMVADGTLHVDGTLDVSASDGLSGPGGHFVPFPPASPSAMRPGAGGAGYRTVGGHGGSATSTGGAFNGGPTLPHPAGLAVLDAGVFLGLPPESLFFTSGAGGGATLVSCRSSVIVSGLIDAGGGGGGGGFTRDLYTDYPPHGGASGGYVAMQGMDVIVTGEVYANGGGGGGGHIQYGAAGGTGENGPRETRAARGGLGDPNFRSGGDGGSVTAAPGPGMLCGGEGAFSGAGGGSVGYVIAFTPAGVTPRIQPAAASPEIEVHHGIVTR